MGGLVYDGRGGAGMVYQDWDALKMEYVTTKTTYAKLAEKYGISISQIKIVAARDGWTNERKKFTARVQQKAYRKACNHEADRLARLITATTGAIDVAMRAIGDDEQGSPPRVRGKVDLVCAHPFALRITPACAGKRGGSSGIAPKFEDHPRVCGEKM